MIDWGTMLAIMYQQSMLLWEFLIFGVYWACPMYFACPYNATRLKYTEEYSSFLRHTLPFGSVVLDFIFSAMRFTGW